MSLTQTYFDRIYSRFLLLICNFPLPSPQQWGACLRPSTIHYLFNTSAHVILIFFYLNSYEKQIYQNTVFMYSTVPFIFNHIVSGQRNIFPKFVKSLFFPLKKNYVVYFSYYSYIRILIYLGFSLFLDTCFANTLSWIVTYIFIFFTVTFDKKKLKFLWSPVYQIFFYG